MSKQQGTTVKFCFECGKELKMGYPANNPENGPARMQCPKGHMTLEEYAFEILTDPIVDAFCDDICNPWPSEEYGLSPEVQDAAKVIQGYLQECRKLAEGAEDGDECDDCNAPDCSKIESGECDKFVDEDPEED